MLLLTKLFQLHMHKSSEPLSLLIAAARVNKLNNVSYDYNEHEILNNYRLKMLQCQAIAILDKSIIIKKRKKKQTILQEQLKLASQQAEQQQEGIRNKQYKNTNSLRIA